MKKVDKDQTIPQTNKPGISRRNFVKAAATMAAVTATVPLQPILGGPESEADASTIPYTSNTRTNDSFLYRRRVAQINKIDIGVLPDNGDRTRFTDFSALYSKALRHDGLGVPNRNSYLSFVNALEDATFADLQGVVVGTPGGGPNSRLNGPATSFAFDLEGRDSHAYPLPPPAPGVATAQTASEQVEHYWGALLRDVPFTQYATNALVAEAVADLNSRSFIKSAANNQFPFPVTSQNLFRGQVFKGDGNVKGPYISQFMLQPTFFGAQDLSQRYRTFLPDQNFMIDVASYQNVQNGGASGEPLVDPIARFIRNGRDLTAYTRVDVLYQGYFVAFLVLAGIGARLNQTNPYLLSNTQKAF
ncbi:MAG TPA: twin-arginine translocation signal domain-containing protein, partial [Pyrinomonadaceae bacterium]|nr:twin-arginine translocation signal domain-containing protein [Pyrinomonadaceae bacterium]